MKILYASCRYNPLDRDAGSGVDFNLYESFTQLGCELKILGPFKDHPGFSEKIFRKAHRVFSRKSTAKFSEAYLHFCAREMDQAAEEYHPDVIFTHNLIPLVYSRSSIPVIYKTDAILFNMHEQWPTYSQFEFHRMLRWEEKALARSSLVVTASHWAEKALVDHYHLPGARILVLPIPSSLPSEIIPSALEPKSISGADLHLLAVAKDYHLKGVDIAAEATRRLRGKGINASLRVVGEDGEKEEGVEFMGLYKKSDPEQLKVYVSHYQWAHLLIHPARYEAAGIVCSEAAAFGVPTITNASGGLATTVEDGVTGIVLPRGSAAADYVSAVERLMNTPELYKRMSEKARRRYEEELNWPTAGRRILSAFESLNNSIRGEKG